MGEIRSPSQVLLVIAAVSSSHDALDWAREWAISTFGKLLLESQRFEFTETNYYEAEMGAPLLKTFFAFEELIDPSKLGAAKRMSNEVEGLFARQSDSVVARPLNLDPGYLSESKLVLASTKDHAHRIYLNEGIYAEITLRYRNNGWRPWEWTYPDYRREDYHAFFTRCRDALRELQMKVKTEGAID